MTMSSLVLSSFLALTVSSGADLNALKAKVVEPFPMEASPEVQCQFIGDFNRSYSSLVEAGVEASELKALLEVFIPERAFDYGRTPATYHYVLKEGEYDRVGSMLSSKERNSLSEEDRAASRQMNLEAADYFQSFCEDTFVPNGRTPEEMPELAPETIIEV